MIPLLAMDGLLLVFLSLSLGCFWILNRRLAAAREGQELLEKLVASLEEATAGAHEAAVRLQAVGQSVQQGCQDRLSSADRLTTDLEVLIAAGERLAGKLEQERTSRHGTAARPRSEAEQALAASLETAE